MKRRLLSICMALTLCLGLLPATALAEGEADSGQPPAESALCEHHPHHDESCGYTEGTEGSPCTHEHDEDCYAPVTSCVHTHTADCYPADPAGGTEAAPEGPAAPAEPAEAEPAACAHVCSAESGCITRVLDCHHTHDGACGYAPAVEGTLCGYVCELCDPQGGSEPGETEPEGTEPTEPDPEPAEPAPEPTEPEETEPTDPEPEAASTRTARCVRPGART